MPRGSRNGPQGYGPMTGRAAGYCAGNSVPGYQNSVPGRAGLGAGQGFGGRGRESMDQFYATGLPEWQRGAGGPAVYPPVPPYPVAPPYTGAPVQVTPQQEADALRNQIGYMEESIKAAQERITELEEKEQ